MSDKTDRYAEQNARRIKRGMRALKRRKRLYVWWQGSGPHRHEDAGWIVSIKPYEELTGQDDYDDSAGFADNLSDALEQLAYQEGRRLETKP